MLDTIIIGAGIGGLVSAAKLLKENKKIVIFEKIHHIGGTSFIFTRGDYIFPMGPLSFSFPNIVNDILKNLGIQNDIQHKRSHFQLISPEMDIIYSQKLKE